MLPTKAFTLLLAISLFTYYTGQGQPKVSSHENSLALVAVSLHSEPSLEQQFIDLENALLQAERTSNVAIADSILKKNEAEDE